MIRPRQLQMLDASLDDVQRVRRAAADIQRQVAASRRVIAATRRLLQASAPKGAFPNPDSRGRGKANPHVPDLPAGG